MRGLYIDPIRLDSPLCLRFSLLSNLRVIIMSENSGYVEEVYGVQKPVDPKPKIILHLIVFSSYSAGSRQQMFNNNS